MNIDERLEKLVERHEALAQTVELMAAMLRANEEQYSRRFAQVMEAINGLVHVAEIHERHLDDLEG